jgi:hypothetical protein
MKSPTLTCDICNTVTSTKKDYAKHLLTRKHIKNGKNQQNEGIPQQAPEEKTTQLECNKCNKKYASRSGLWRHYKLCSLTAEENIIIQPIITDPIITDPTIIDTDNAASIAAENKVIELLIKENADFKNIILEFMKTNSDMQKQMIDVCKNNNNTTNHINSHNKTFNLNVFLNEQCKDAMNISEFANTFDLQLEDLESVGELGYVDGISKIIVDKLNAMDIYKRPMHCSDAKREIIYVKDENVWTKEEKNNPKIRQAIKNISFKNMKLVYNWSNANPESKNNESLMSDKYIKLVLQSSGGQGPILESENKIIRRIVREIIIGKAQHQQQYQHQQQHQQQNQ